MSAIGTAEKLEDLDLLIVENRQPIKSMRRCEKNQIRKMLCSIGFERKELKKFTVTRLVPRLID